MKQCNLNINYYKDSKNNLESTVSLLNSGYVKKIESSQYVLTASGEYLYAKFFDNMKVFFDKNLYFKMNYENLNSYIYGEIKSSRSLPLKLYYAGISDDEDYKDKLGFIGSKSKYLVNGVAIIENFQDHLLESEKLLSNFNELTKSIDSKVWISTKLPNYMDDYTLFSTCEKGNDKILKCQSCGESFLHEYYDGESINKLENNETSEFELEEIYTEDMKTVKIVADFFHVSHEKILKTLVIKVGKVLYAVALRGSDELNIYKVARYLKVPASEVSLASPKDVLKYTGSEIGYVGPIGIKNMKLIIDIEVVKIPNMVCGANKKDYHYKNANFGRDFKSELIFDVKTISKYDNCHICSGRLDVEYGVNICNIKSYSDKVSSNLAELRYKDALNMIKFAYKIDFKFSFNNYLSILFEEGLKREKMYLNPNDSYFNCHLILTNSKDDAQKSRCDYIYESLTKEGIRVLYDDGSERVGTKFLIADYLAIPKRIVVSSSSEVGIFQYFDLTKNLKVDLTFEDIIRNFK